MSELFDDKRIVLPIIAVLLVISTVWFGDAELTAAVAEAERQQRLVLSEVARTRTLVAELRAERQYLEESAPLADVLEDADFTSAQDRLAASAAVETLGEAHRIARLRASFAPEETFGDRPYTGKALVLVSTPVTLVAEALTRSDMEMFLIALPDVFTGVATIETLNWRQSDETAPATVSAQILLRWETVRPAEASP